MGYMKKPPKITKEMRIFEIIQKFPKITPIFLSYGLYCAGCPAAQSETIEEAAKTHQINLKKFLSDLNKAIR